MSRHKILFRLLLLAGLILPAASAQRAAGQLLEFEASCTEVLCGQPRFLYGEAREDNSGRAIPFETEILSSRAGQCIRVEVLAQNQPSDMEAVLVAPDGTVWRNDDAGAASTTRCDFCPIIKAVSTVAGWYTLQISPYNGSSGNPNWFYWVYGLYSPGNNVNCSGATTPQAPEPQSVKPVLDP